MSIDKLMVTVFGFMGIIFIYWFFLNKKDKEIKVSENVDIIVEGGYSPSAISIINGKTTIINFIRKDTNSCLEEVILPDFKVKRHLPLNERVTIELTPTKKGEFEYTCSMGMYKGKIIVN